MRTRSSLLRSGGAGANRGWRSRVVAGAVRTDVARRGGRRLLRRSVFAIDVKRI